ncbi:MAG: acyl-ACP--UDP-N-acetylglucosamine O-acyltransferase [Planctomycetota bacterium]
MSGFIDSRAVIHPEARIGQDVHVGPFCVIGAAVTIGDRCRLVSHTVVEGPTELGADNIVSPMASIGGPPQDLKFAGESTALVVGCRNRIREYVTLNRGTAGGGGVTRIGDDNLFMAGAHVGHDSQVGSGTVFANAATLAGHVEVGDHATIGAFSGVHQFCRVARSAFVGGYSVVTQDALPWVLTVGNRAKSHGLNLVGLKRGGYTPETINALKRCYMRLFRSKLRLADALDQVEQELGHFEEVRYFVDFVRGSKRGVCR